MIYVGILNDFLFFFFALFAISSTCSIAIAQISLGVSFLIYLIIIIIQKKIPYIQELKWLYISIGLYVFWMLLSSVLGPTPLKSLSFVKEEWLFLIIPMGIYLFRKEKFRRYLITVFSAAIILTSIYGLIQFFTGATWFSSDNPVPAPVFGYRISGFFSYGVTFGNFISIAGSFLIIYAFIGKKALSTKHFYIFLSSGLAAVLMAVLTFSRAPLLALIVVFLFLLVLFGRRWWKGFLISLVVFAALLVIIPGVSDRFINEFDKEYSGVHQAGRVYIWNNSFKIISENPFIGVGKGNFKDAYSVYIPPDSEEIRKVTSAHNDVIDITANTGIPGGLLYLFLWGTVMVLLLKKYKQAEQNDNIEYSAILLAVLCGSLCFFVISMFHGTFVDDEVRHLLMLLWGIGFSAYQVDIKPNEQVK